MISLANILICAAVALACYAPLGMLLARRVVDTPRAWFIAPGLGWAVHSAAALPVFFVFGFSPAAAAAVLILPALIALALELRSHPSRLRFTMPPVVWIFVLIAATALSVVVMAGVLPKYSAEGVSLAGTIFDHSKVAMIDEMRRVGIPPGNPFFGEAGQPVRLTYYYLWHFSAAELAMATGVSGWEADAALTWFTAFASLMVMIGLATWMSGRASTAWWVILLAATAAWRILIYWVGFDNASEYVGYASGFGGWMFQTSWAPQHTASAMSTVLALVMLVQLAGGWSWAAFAAFVLTMVASFQSSTWIGAFVLPLAAAIVTLDLLIRAQPERRLKLLLTLAGAAILALVMIAPFLRDQMTASMARGDGAPISVIPYEVLGDAVSDRVGDTVTWWANLPAFWLVFLVIEWPAFYLPGLAGMVRALKTQTSGEPARFVRAFAITIAASLIVSWLLVSTLGENNDLGWRAALPAIFFLIVFAAVGLTHWMRRPKSFAMVASALLIALGIPDAVVVAQRSIAPGASPSSAGFAAAPDLWNAVRQYAARDVRVANNPLALEKSTPWPVNIGWALLANRRSCYAGSDLVRPFTALSAARRTEIDALFKQVFSGEATEGEVSSLATQYDCSVVVITPEDGAWSRKPAMAPYRMVEDKPGWRIYVRSTGN